jgi:sulfonate transport system substrate-binding protein
VPPAPDAALPRGSTLRFADQNDTFSQPWDLSGAGAGAPYQVRWARFSGGPPVLEAIRSGAADVGYVGENVLPIALANAPDPEWVVIAAFATGGGGTYLAVHGDRIRSVADLRGRTIAYPRGTGREVFVARALQAAGLSLDDERRVEVPGTEVGPVFSSGRVDAAALLGAQKFRSNNPVVLADSRGYGGALGVLVTRSSVLADPCRAAALGDFIARSTAASNWVTAHPSALIRAQYVGEQGLTEAQGTDLYQNTGPTRWRPVDASVAGNRAGRGRAAHQDRDHTRHGRPDEPVRLPVHRPGRGPEPARRGDARRAAQ